MPSSEGDPSGMLGVDVHDLWVVYERPADYPDAMVARRFLVIDGVLQPTVQTLVCRAREVIEGREAWSMWRDHLLRDMREMILREKPGALCYDRDDTDDPVVVETWQ